MSVCALMARRQCLEYARAKEILYCLQYGDSWLQEAVRGAGYCGEGGHSSSVFIRALSFNNKLSSLICPDIGSDTFTMPLGARSPVGRAFRNLPAVAT